MKFLLNYAYEEHFLHFIAFLQQLRALKYNIKTLLTADAVTVKVDPMHCLFSKDLCSSFGNRRALDLHWFLCQTFITHKQNKYMEAVFVCCHTQYLCVLGCLSWFIHTAMQCGFVMGKSVRNGSHPTIHEPSYAKNPLQT